MNRIVIIGSGASGIVSAIFSKKDDNEVIVLEKNNDSLKKLLITGNGKCNYFNDDFSINNYSSNNIDMLKKIITNDNKNKVLNFIDSIGIKSRVKNGYYYPASNQAFSIHNALIKESNILGVILKNNYEVKSIKKIDNIFIINDEIKCNKLVISTGSMAYPKTGSTGDGYRFAEYFNIKVNSVYPALVALKSDNKLLKELDGVRVECKVTNSKNNVSEMGELQFTKEALSGICIYNLSIDNNIDNIVVNLLNSFNINSIDEFLREMDKQNRLVKNRTITELLEGYLNYKIVNAVLKYSKIDYSKNYNVLTKREKEILGNNLVNLNFKIIDRKDYNSSQVCGGGISLEEININTFESKKVKDLYFTGELLDVCGKCGGYNLGFAFLSGMIVGENIND